MRPVFANKKGYLLPMVIIYMVIAMIVGSGILLLGSLERIAASKRLFREQAFYLAEAGINWARFNLKADNSWVPNPNPVTVNLGAGTFQLSETVNGNIVLVTSIGTVKGVTEKTSMTVTKGSGSIFSKGMFGSNLLVMWNNSLVDSYDSRLGPYGGTNVGSEGDVGSNDWAILYNNSTVQGDASVSAGGHLLVGGSVDISGDKIYDAEQTDLPPVVIPADLSGLAYPVQGDARITPSGNYSLHNGVLTVFNNKTVTISGGNFRFKQISVGGNSKINVTGDIRFYVADLFTLSNNSQFNLSGTGEMYMGTSCTMAMGNNSQFTSQDSPGSLAIYNASYFPTILCNGSSIISAAIYAPEALVTVWNNASFSGSIVAQQLVLSNNASVHYDVALRDVSPPGAPGGGTGITFVSWTKPDWVK